MLHQALGALAPASGKISGQITEGGTTRKLTGTVELSRSGSHIDILEGNAADPKPIRRAETIVGGNRYLRINTGPWVNHGSNPYGPGLAGALAGIDTSTETGIESFAGKQLHRIQVPMNGLDSGSAFGFEVQNWRGKDGTFRVFADDMGAVVGFGATINWSQMVRGVLTECKMTIDVTLDAVPSATVTAPDAAWQWTVDNTGGMAFGLPADWKFVPMAGTAAGVYTAANSSLIVATTPIFGSTDDMVKWQLGSLKPDSQYACSYSGETGTCFTMTSKTTTAFIFGLLVTHSGLAYFLVIGGVIAKQQELETIFNQAVDTVEFAN